MENNPVLVFKRDENSNDWTIDREILKKIYLEIDGDATMSDIEEVLLTVEKNWKDFLEGEKAS